MNIINAVSLEAVHTHTHTLCLLDKTSELYIVDKILKIDTQLLHRQTVF